MKKFLTLLLAFVMLVSCMVPAYAAEALTARTNAVDLRIGIIGDTHAGLGQTTFANNLEAHKTLGANKLDGFILTGDIIYYNNTVEPACYDSVVADLTTAGKPYAFAMGNHEYPLHASNATITAEARSAFEEKTGKNPKHVTTFSAGDKTYYAIAAAAEDYQGHVSAETEAWLMAEIDKAIAATSTNATEDAFTEGVIPNSSQPVFVALHHPIDGTIFDEPGPGDGVRGYTEEFVAYLKNRPQVIVLTGHRHVPEQLPETIWQDGFTMYQTSVSAGGSLVAWGCDASGDVSGESQTSMIEIKDDVVSIVKYDLKRKEEIGEPWTIDVPAIVADRTDADDSNDADHYLYSADKRENPVKPQFAADAELAVAVADGFSASITWPNSATVTGETPNQQDGFVRGYKAEIVDVAKNAVVASKIYQNEYYAETQSASFTYNVNLDYGKTYQAKVSPMGALGSFGRAITKTFTIEPEVVPEGAVRIEFDELDDAYKNSSGGSKGAVISADRPPIDGDADGNNYYNIPFTVTVEEDGIYELSTVMAEQTHVGNNSQVDVILYDAEDNEEIILTNKKGTLYAKDLKAAAYYGSMPGREMRLYKTLKELAAGTYNLELRVWERGTNRDQNYLHFCADYFQLAPYTYPAVTTDAPVRIEYESFAAQIGFSEREDDDASGKKYIATMGAGVAGVEAFTMTERISIPADGKYDVSYVTYNTTGNNNYSIVDFYLVNVSTGEETILGDNKTAPTETFATGTYGSFSNVGRYDKKGIALTAGLYDVKTVLNGTVTDADFYYFLLDYIEVKAEEREIISAAEDTYFELEKYANTSDPDYNEIIPDSTAHGGSYMKDSWAMHNDPSASIPVYIEGDGYYDIEYVVGLCSNQKSYSKMVFKLDDTILGTNCNQNAKEGMDDEGLASYETIEGYTEQYSGTPMHKFTNDKVWLTKGSHVLTIEYGFSMTGDIKVWKYNADYIAFKPYDREAVSATGATWFEVEEYMAVTVPNNDPAADDGDNEVTADAAASGGYYVEDYYGASDPSIIVPVTVAKSGYYDFEYVMSYCKALDSYSIITISMGDTVIGDNTQKGEEQTEYGYTEKTSGGLAFHKYNKNMVLLEAGTNVLTMTVKNPSHGRALYRADYIKISPSTPDVSSDNVARYEVEEYIAETVMNVNLDKNDGDNEITADAAASGGYYVEDYYGWSDPSIEVPVFVGESGYYNIEYVISHAPDTNSYGKLSIIMDGTVIGDSAARDGVVQAQYGSTYTSSGLPFHKYNRTVWLEAGKHTLEMEGVTSANGAYYMYRADYIQIAPTEELTVNGAKVSATATYDEPVTGKAVLALYNGDDYLVSTITENVTNTRVIKMETAEGNDFTKAVIYIWHSFEDVKPLALPVEFIYNN